MLSINPSEISVENLQTYLQCAIAPRPIALASTIDKNGVANLSPFSFFNMFSTQPPILIFSPARRIRNNTTKHTLENVKNVKEVVINMVNFDIVQQMSLSSTEYPQGVNEFEKAGFTMLASHIVRPFRVAESPIQLECNVNEIVSLGSEGGAGNLIICEVVKIHINKKYLDDQGNINQHMLDLVARAGGNYYTRANKGFFEIPKPLANLGVGVDAIPIEFRKSTVLTGNDLGLLGNIEAIPSIEDVNKFAKEHSQYIGVDYLKKHTFVKSLLEKNDVVSAWKALLMK